MINAVHVLFDSPNPEVDRAFLRDVLGFAHVDDGQGWLIFKLPPAEVGVHPAEKAGSGFYFMCDDLESTLSELTAKGVEVVQAPSNQGWGIVSWIRLPGGAEMGLYQPFHKTAHGL